MQLSAQPVVPEELESEAMDFSHGRNDTLQKLALDMDVRCLSVRDIEHTLRNATGDLLSSRSTASDCIENRQEDYDACRQCALVFFRVENLFVNGEQRGGRHWNRCQGNFCAWGICRDGSQVLPYLSLNSQQSCGIQLDFTRHTARQGLQMPVLFTMHGAPGLI